MLLTEQQRKQQIKHRELYSKVNKHARDIAAVCPDMSPLHVLRGAIQQHQLSPVLPDNATSSSTSTVQVMPDIPVYDQTPQRAAWSDKVETLSAVLPDIPRATLEDMICEERGNLDAIVAKVLCEDDPPQPNTTPYECANACSIQADDYAEASLKLARSTEITSDHLKTILHTVAKKEESQQQQHQPEQATGRILSFHKPERTTINTIPEQSNYWSNLLSSDDTSGLCPICLTCIDLTSNFCSICGHILKKKLSSPLRHR